MAFNYLLLIQSFSHMNQQPLDSNEEIKKMAQRQAKDHFHVVNNQLQVIAHQPKNTRKDYTPHQTKFKVKLY
jgi:hypothetical protein